ncbi:MAG TPA: hypothetical protein VMS08_05220 [Candidatus Saccharimonadia bacterium]|nr:hypothetical protein [Candidatus Saccharimonadia bacterium]
MKRRVYGLLLTAALTVFATIGSARAAGGLSPNPLGGDVSYPQCGQSLPSGQAFGVVGVNGGTAGNFNPCLEQELTWANTSSGFSGQPRVQLYANTGNPGDITPAVADWPQTSNPLIDPYGSCAGRDNQACSWQYGYERGYADAATATAGVWWLDVETVNSWSTNTANNRADLEGMTYAFTISGSTVGVYSIPAWWSLVAGPVTSSSRLYYLPEWLPGASTQSEAKSNCRLRSFTGGGNIELTQYTSRALDYDVSCI